MFMNTLQPILPLTPRHKMEQELLFKVELQSAASFDFQAMFEANNFPVMSSANLEGRQVTTISTIVHTDGQNKKDLI